MSSLSRLRTTWPKSKLIFCVDLGNLNGMITLIHIAKRVMTNTNSVSICHMELQQE